MQVAFRNLLATALVALVGACSLNNNGLLGAGGVAGAGSQGAGGVGGTTGTAGTAGMTPIPSGSAGTTSPAGSAGATDVDAATVDSAVTGAAGGNPSGVAGESGSGGDNGSAGDNGAGGSAGDSTGAAGDTGAAGALGSAGAGGSMVTPVIDPVGCSDGTREGFVDLTTYPSIAACAGGWEEPGLLSMASRMPQCDRSAGNEGNNPDGGGCSVADLCSVGWHVCETAKAVSVATAGMGCAPAYELYLAKPAFFVTRQRAEGLVCDPTNQNGDNNVYGCGNIGSAADKSCAPFMHMLRDSDCANHRPWSCADGQVGNSQDEYDVVTKAGAAEGGVLCCKDGNARGNAARRAPVLNTGDARADL